MIAMPFMRRPRSSGKSSDDSAFDAVLMLADASPNANSADAASTALDAVANIGRHSATSADDTISEARCPSASTKGPESRLPNSSPVKSVEISRPRSASVNPNC